MQIIRTWMKCFDCGAAWYCDTDDCFDGCYDCGGEFFIVDQEDVTAFYEANQKES